MLRCTYPRHGFGSLCNKLLWQFNSLILYFFNISILFDEIKIYYYYCLLQGYYTSCSPWRSVAPVPWAPPFLCNEGLFSVRCCWGCQGTDRQALNFNSKFIIFPLNWFNLMNIKKKKKLGVCTLSMLSVNFFFSVQYEIPLLLVMSRYRQTSPEL